MSDLIRRNHAISAAKTGADDWDGGCNIERDRYIEKAFADIPAVDAVEVVRCRECKCYPKDFDEDSWNWCCGIGDDTKPNDFCSYGQRREDGDGDV